MPHKFNATRRDKIPKQKYRVTNWAEYNERLRRRGDCIWGWTLSAVRLSATISRNMRLVI